MRKKPSNRPPDPGPEAPTTLERLDIIAAGVEGLDSAARDTITRLQTGELDQERAAEISRASETTRDLYDLEADLLRRRP